MKIVKTRSEASALWWGNGVAFVPTMGALHDGHLSLVSRAKAEGQYVVASIFVNPTQFNNRADFDNYPADLQNDLTLLEGIGCDAVFVPTETEVYHAEAHSENYLHYFPALADQLEGEFRPGHFRGMLQVVHLLFEAVHPAVAYFGEKDYQQLLLVKELVKHLPWPIDVVPVPTSRLSSGLAMSSRNRRLSADGLVQAAELFKALQWAKAEVARGTHPRRAADQSRARLKQLPQFKVEYFEARNALDLSLFGDRYDANCVRFLVAAWLEGVRLIDNL